MFISTRVSVPSSEMGPSTRVCLFPLLVLAKSMHNCTLACVGVGGGPNSDERAETLVLYVSIIPLPSGRTSWRWRRATASFRLRESTRRLRRTGRPSSRDSSLGGQFKFLSMLAQRDSSLLLKTKLTASSLGGQFNFLSVLSQRDSSLLCWRPSSRASSLGGQLKFLSVLAQRWLQFVVDIKCFA